MIRCACAFCTQSPQKSATRFELPAIVRSGTTLALLYADGPVMYIVHGGEMHESFAAASAAASAQAGQEFLWQIPTTAGIVMLHDALCVTGTTDYKNVRAMQAAIDSSAPCVLFSELSTATIDEMSAIACGIFCHPHNGGVYDRLLREHTRRPCVDACQERIGVIVPGAGAPASGQITLRRLPSSKWSAETVMAVLAHNADERFFCVRILKWRDLPCRFPALRNTWNRREALCRVEIPGTEKTVDIWLPDVIVRTRAIQQPAPVPWPSRTVAFPPDTPKHRALCCFVDFRAWLRLPEDATAEQIVHTAQALRRVHQLPAWAHFPFKLYSLEDARRCIGNRVPPDLSIVAPARRVVLKLRQ